MEYQGLLFSKTLEKYHLSIICLICCQFGEDLHYLGQAEQNSVFKAETNNPD